MSADSLVDNLSAMISQWLRFPFAMAGPLSAAVLSILCLCSEYAQSR